MTKKKMIMSEFYYLSSDSSIWKCEFSGVMKNVEVVVIISSGMDLKIPTDIAVLVVEI